MRIVHVSEAFGGGLRSAIVNYVRASPQHRHHLVVRTRVGHETFEVPAAATTTVFDGTLVGFLEAARREVLDGAYDVVHLHSSYAGLLRAVLPAGVRIVYSPHCYAMEAGHPWYKRSVYRSVERALAQRDQMLMAVSPREIAIGHELRFGMPSREVPNSATPLDVVDYRAERAEVPTVVMLGRIADQKDPRFFAEVADLVGSRCAFLWIGEGAQGRMHLERAGVQVTGWVDPAEVRRLMISADLYLHTAAWEGAPLSTLEAAEMGCPVISRAIPSMVTLGYALGGTTPVEMAVAVRRFFVDPDYQSRVRAATGTVTGDYTFDLMAGRLSEAYDFALRRLGSPRSAKSAAEHVPGMITG
ncbi:MULTISPECIES: glycosyltransferase family 4 protein [Nocardiaceae]|uniref:Glycosyltransferase family 4 protein n=1 Tax=Rhodococcoides kroppenstedtii TaxID=293050 RepID=A0ABS7NVZ1_9NOCA|nr:MULTISPECIES: glycosyltransferase family 4 protein [Rhodococcus]AMY20486.1 hypothetical protein A3Q40_03124 [Rhodococcus sp. PBTS 1]MBY6314320.1 glycosyltransferase family 4 protein [Rhodococcus kroppenstedtii]MBY6322219.1 glycosyltransferase family 4 protein [Rhodococcus kroppenstedtii]MBY6401032.1 glycosyltransferase family 4 protein [Rhodococcus kroppenstedtii]